MVVRVVLGDQTYVLPVRSMRANREWRETLDAKTTDLLNGLDASGNDLSSIYSLLAGQRDEMIEMLLSYDTVGILPSRDEIEDIEPDASLQVLDAVREVWRAADPLVAIAVMTATIGLMPSGSLEPTSSLPPSTTGSTETSRMS
jgi:hypothetical protein